MNMKSTVKKNKNNTYDVIISGGGVPGLVLGCLLDQLNLRVAVIDPKPVDTTLTLPPTGRTVALMQTSIAPLIQTSIWTDKLKQLSGRLESLSIADDDNMKSPLKRVDFHAHELNIDTFGYNIPLPQLHQEATRAFLACTSTKLIIGKIISFETSNHDITVTLDDNSKISANLLVAADGRKSVIREQSGLEHTSHDYDQIAITGLISHSKFHNNNSVEFHRSGGPFTLVPLPDNHSSFVWVEKTQDAEKFLTWRKPDLESAIQERSRGIVGGIKLIAGPEAYPLMRLRAKTFTAPHIALIAESAHVMSPIGAQGLNLSLRDVTSLYQQIENALSLGFNISDPVFLKRYEQERQPDINIRVRATDGLNRLVSNNSHFMATLRRAGMNIVSKPSLLRHFMMQEAFSPQVKKL